MGKTANKTYHQRVFEEGKIRRCKHSINRIVEIKTSIAEEKVTFEKTLQEIVDRIVAVASPDRIILFGSAALGQAGPDSDLDLLVIKEGAHRRELTRRIYRNLIGVGRAIDLVVATPQDVERYRHSPALVIEPAIREGREIYARKSVPS